MTTLCLADLDLRELSALQALPARQVMAASAGAAAVAALTPSDALVPRGSESSSVRRTQRAGETSRWWMPRVPSAAGQLG